MNRLMRMYTLRDVSIGFFAAMAAFSYALCTTPSPLPSERIQSGSRDNVGGNLQFTNPMLASNPNGLQNYDLGDTILGSQLVRYLSARAGVQPYVFSLGSAGSGAFSSLTVAANGRVNAAVLATSNSVASFTGNLADAAAVTRSGLFTLGVVGGVSRPRFAMDRLPTGQVGLDYITNMEVLGGDTTTTVFSVVPGSITLGSTAVPNLEFMGLTLFSDGMLAGRPLAFGTLTFTARASRNGVLALNRAGTTQDQVFAINIAPMAIVQSVFATTKATVKGGTSSLGTSLDLFAIINPNGRSFTDFANSKVSFRFAGEVFSATMNSNGVAQTGPLTVILGLPSGQIHVSLRAANIAAFLDTTQLVNRSNFTAVAELELGNFYLGTEPIQFTVQNHRGRFQLQYRLGKQRQLGGLFQVISLAANDFTTGTAFKELFLISHVKGQTDVQFGVPTAATVHIGPGVNQTVVLRRGRGVFRSPSSVRSLNINVNNKTGVMTTYPLTTAQTGIQPGSAGQVQTFLFGLDLTTTTLNFSGDSSLKIFPVGGH